MSAEKRFYTITAVFLSICSIVPIWSTEFFPSQNGPAFLNIVHMFKEIDNPSYAYGNYFVSHPHYMPYLPMYGMLLFFSSFFSLAIANKLMLTVIVLLFPVAVFFFLFHLHHDRIVFGFSSYLIIYNYAFMRGYYNFIFAGLVMFIFLSFWLRFKPSLSPGKLIVLNLLLLAVYLSHLIVTVLLLLILFIIMLLEGKSPKELMVHYLKIGTPVFLSIAYYLYFSSEYSIWNEEAHEIKHWWFKTENFYLRFLWPYSHFGRTVAAIPFLIILMKILVDRGGALQCFVKKKAVTVVNSNENRLLIIFTSMIGIYYLFPWKVMGWHKADAHLILFIFIFLMVCPRPFSNRLVRISFVGLCAILSLVFYFQAGAKTFALSNEIKHEFLAASGRLRANTKMLAISAGGNSYVVVNPYAHLFDYYSITDGIMTGQSLAAYNTISPVWYKNYDEFPNFHDFPRIGINNLTHDTIEIIRHSYDYVLVWGNDPVVLGYFHKNGFLPVFEKNRLHIFQPDRSGVESISVELSSGLREN